MDVEENTVNCHSKKAEDTKVEDTPKKEEYLSKEAQFISKLISTIKTTELTPYNIHRQYYDDFFRSEIPKALTQYHENKTPITNPLIQLVFNMENMFDDVYKRAKEDVKLEILTEIEAVYKLKKRGESSSESGSDSFDEFTDYNKEGDNILVDTITNNHISTDDLF